MTMKKPDSPCLILALFAFLHVYLLLHDDAGMYLHRLGSPRAEICFALAWLGGYYGARAWIRPYSNDDLTATSILAILGIGSALFRPFL